MNREEYFKKYINTDSRAGTVPLNGQYRSDEKEPWLLKLINSLPDPDDVLDTLARIAIIVIGICLVVFLNNPRGGA